MAERIHSLDGSHLARIEPEDRLVVLARTIQVRASEAELKNGAANWARFGETCLGQALYRHRSVFRNASDAAVWSHLELSYFRDIVPAEIIHELVVRPQPPGDATAARRDSSDHPLGLRPARETGRAQPIAPNGRRRSNISTCNSPYLGEYREIMRNYIGPAAAKLVRGEPDRRRSGRWRRPRCSTMTRR